MVDQVTQGVELETNAEAIAAKYQASLVRYREILIDRFASTGRRVDNWIRDNQFSGRPPGLNIVTGNLHDSLHDLVTVDYHAFSVSSEVYNHGAPYWYYHEYPEGDLPDYLHIHDFYHSQALEWYQNDVKEAIEALTK